jgi:hypothetical protein
MDAFLDPAKGSHQAGVGAPDRACRLRGSPESFVPANDRVTLYRAHDHAASPFRAESPSRTAHRWVQPVFETGKPFIFVREACRSDQLVYARRCDIAVAGCDIWQFADFRVGFTFAFDNPCADCARITWNQCHACRECQSDV